MESALGSVHGDTTIVHTVHRGVKYILRSTFDAQQKEWKLCLTDGASLWFTKKLQAPIDLNDAFLTRMNVKSWEDFGNAIRQAFSSGDIHVTVAGQKCVISLNATLPKKQTFELTPSRAEPTQLLFELASDCAAKTSGGVHLQASPEKDKEIASLKDELKQLRYHYDLSKSVGIVGTDSPSSKVAKKNVPAPVKRKPGMSLVNPRVKARPTKGPSFADSDSDDDK